MWPCSSFVHCQPEIGYLLNDDNIARHFNVFSKESPIYELYFFNVNALCYNVVLLFIYKFTGFVEGSSYLLIY